MPNFFGKTFGSLLLFIMYTYRSDGRSFPFPTIRRYRDISKQSKQYSVGYFKKLNKNNTP